MRVYYDLILWEEVDENDTEKLRQKFAEMGKRFQGYGVLSFKMRAQPDVTQEQLQQMQAAAQQQPAQEPQYADEPPLTPEEEAALAAEDGAQGEIVDE